jgi:hypothetical protein
MKKAGRKCVKGFISSDKSGSSKLTGFSSTGRKFNFAVTVFDSEAKQSVPNAVA